jgi:hypothetical protein
VDHLQRSQWEQWFAGRRDPMRSPLAIVGDAITLATCHLDEVGTVGAQHGYPQLQWGAIPARWLQLSRLVFHLLHGGGVLGKCAIRAVLHRSTNDLDGRPHTADEFEFCGSEVNWAAVLKAIGALIAVKVPPIAAETGARVQHSLLSLKLPLFPEVHATDPANLAP